MSKVLLSELAKEDDLKGIVDKVLAACKKTKGEEWLKEWEKSGYAIETDGFQGDTTYISPDEIVRGYLQFHFLD